MARQQDLWAEKINIFQTHDGENISKYIKDTLASPKYNFQVSSITFSDDMVTSLATAVCVIILTEQSLQEFKNRPTEFFNKLCPNSAPVVVLNYQPSTNMDHDSVKKMVSNKGINCSDKKVVTIGKKEGYRKAFIKIMGFADQTEPVELPTVKQFIMHPTEIWKDSQEIVVVFTNENDRRKKVKVKVVEADGKEKMYDAAKKSSCVFTFTPTGIIPGKCSIEILVDDVSSGKGELILKSEMELISSLLTDVTHPIHLLCQSLGINIVKEDLDRELADMLNRAGEDPLNMHFLDDMETPDGRQKCELPTMLHFGAKFGLKYFCEELMKLPGGKLALNIKNKDGKKPYNLAAMAQANDLVTILIPIENNEDEHEVFSATGAAEDDGYMTMRDLHTQTRERKESDIRSPAELRFSSTSTSSSENVVMRRLSSTRRRESGYDTSFTSSGDYTEMTRRMTMMLTEDDERLSTKL